MTNAEDRPPDRPALHSPVALRVLAALGVGFLLYLGQAAFAPVAIAMLLSLVLATPVEALFRRGWPRGLSALLILLIFVGVVGESIDLAWKPAQSWWTAAPQTLRTIESRIRPVTMLVGRMAAFTSRASEMVRPAAGVAPTADGAGKQPAPANNLPPANTMPSANTMLPSTTMVEVLGQTRAAVVDIVTVGILTFFLMAGGPPMFARMGAALASDVQATQVLKVIDDVRGEVGRYYASIALINVGLGLATALVTMLLGMPSPFLWGVVAGVLNFIPYVGSATTLVLLTVTAFVTFNTTAQVAVVAGSYLGLATIEGQLVQPLVVGRRLKLNPIIVFLALWFGGWFWGIAGIVMAVPSLVGLKVVADHSKNGRPLAEFLGPSESRGMRPKLRVVLKRKRTPE